MAPSSKFTSERFLFLFTCEHATNKIPFPYRPLFREARQILSTHRGWDAGAAPVARRMARACQSPLIEGTHSRLLVDLNRTEDNPGVFSPWTRVLDHGLRQTLLQTYHRPHWSRVETEVDRLMKRAQESGRTLVHLGIHSFTPVMHGYRRPTALGLLLDPSRPREAAMALEWQKKLRRHSDLVIHRNRPYRGTGNGLISDLRQRYSPRDYLGLEIELNQNLVESASAQTKIAKLLLETLPR